MNISPAAAITLGILIPSSAFVLTSLARSAGVFTQGEADAFNALSLVTAALGTAVVCCSGGAMVSMSTAPANNQAAQRAHPAKLAVNQ